MIYHRVRVLRLLQVALFIMIVADGSLHAQRRGSGGHMGVSSHGSPSFSSTPRGFAAGRAPTAQNHHQKQHRLPTPEHRGGVGYRNRYPYFYGGYPALFPFGYATATEDSAPPLAPEDTNPQPADPPPEVAADNAPMFRPAYQPQWAPAPPQPATTLVFNDGRPSMEVHNYALTGKTLYALDNEKRLEIPLSQLDVPATTEANRKTGVDFALPINH